MLVRLLVALTITASFAAQAQSSDAVHQEIEAGYARALDAMLHAKPMKDLDELNRSFDKRDWQSIVPGQQPRTGQELRKYGFEGLRMPFQSLQFSIGTIAVPGNVAPIPLKETRRKTVIGWKRQIHQKFPSGETPK